MSIKQTWLMFCNMSDFFFKVKMKYIKPIGDPNMHE